MSDVLDLPSLASVPPLKQPLEGGTFCGVITLPDGKHYAAVLLADKPDASLPWKKAAAWAEGLGNGAVLPTRPVAAMLFANAKDQFEPEWHWTSEAFDGSCAWTQYFNYGLQISHRESYEGRCRAVRLIQLTA